MTIKPMVKDMNGLSRTVMFVRAVVANGKKKSTPPEKSPSLSMGKNMPAIEQFMAYNNTFFKRLDVKDYNEFIFLMKKLIDDIVTGFIAEELGSFGG